MKKILFIVLVLLMANSAEAEGFKTEKELRSFSEKFMDQIVNSDFQNAFNATKQNWPLPEVEIDGIVNQIEQQWPMISNRFGKSVGKEWIREKRIGKSFLRYYYLHKFQNHAIYWFIDFYKPVNVWQINSVVFRDDLNILFE